jgi:dihydroorotate dehydrogenase
MYFSRPEQIDNYIRWGFGSFGGVSWETMKIYAPVVIFALVIAVFLAKTLNTLLLGETYAQSMGLDVKQARRWIILSTALLAGTITAFCGPIGFIGLAVPHLCRSLFNTSDHRILIPATIMMGSIVALVADVIAAMPGTMSMSLPLNAVTALIGAPVVVWVILRRAVQAREAGAQRVATLARAIGADAVCIHLNVAQELVQDDGDRDFRGLLRTLSQLVQELPVPVIVKETGCGLAPRTLARLSAAGVRWVDVAGAGGTSWTGVESLRGSARQRALGGLLREWGVPTAASIGYAERAGFGVIASGGIRDAIDVARALALGAQVAGLALPFLRAWAAGGTEGVINAAEALSEGLRAVMALTGARRVEDLRGVPRVLGPELDRWLALRSPGEPTDRSERFGQQSRGVGSREI